MALNQTTTVAVAPTIKQYYDRLLLQRSLPKLVHRRYGVAKPIPLNSGKTVSYRRWNSLPVTTVALTEGAPPASTNLSISEVTATIRQDGDFVEVTDLFEDVAIDSVGDETVTLLAEQAAEKLDTLCRNVINAGTTVQFADGVGARANVAAANIITADEVLLAVRTLRANRAPRLSVVTDDLARTVAVNSYVGIIGAFTWADLMRDPLWVEAAKYAGSVALFEGEVGSLYGVRFVLADNSSVFAAAGFGGIDVHATLVIGAEAYGITRLGANALEQIPKPRGSAGTADPLNQKATWGWKANGVPGVILDDSRMVRIEHAVSN